MISRHSFRLAMPDSSHSFSPNLVPRDGEARVWRGFVPERDAQHCFDVLRVELAWHAEHISMYGRSIAVPRLVAWYGNADAVYTYSGVTHAPLPWHPLLLQLRDRISAVVHAHFNSVLANLYRNGADSMGWHADKEPELGPEPVIASLSFGATRVFKLQHNKTKQRVDVALASGDLLLMAGVLQRCWRHSLPKTTVAVGERINLTYRFIQRT